MNLCMFVLYVNTVRITVSCEINLIFISIFRWNKSKLSSLMVLLKVHLIYTSSFFKLTNKAELNMVLIKVHYITQIDVTVLFNEQFIDNLHYRLKTL